MSHLLTRIKDSISSDLNELLDRKEQQNPIALLNQHLRRCEQEARRVRQLIDRQYLLKDTLLREYNQAEERAEKRSRQAEIAERAGEEELRAFAISEQRDYAKKADRLKLSVDQAANRADHLEKKYAEMKRKLKDMHLKRMELMSRENVANAERRMNRVLSPDQAFGQSLYQFEESEMYLERLEKKINSDYFSQTFDSRIRQLKRRLDEDEN